MGVCVNGFHKEIGLINNGLSLFDANCITCVVSDLANFMRPIQ